MSIQAEWRHKFRGESDQPFRYDVASHQVVFSWLDIRKATDKSEGGFGQCLGCWNVYLEADHVEIFGGILSNGNKDQFGFQICWTKKVGAASTCQYTFQVTWVGSMKGSDWIFLQPRNSTTLGSGDLLKMTWNLKVYVILRCIQKSVGTEHLDASQGSITWMPESTPPKQYSRSNLCDHLTERRWPSIRWASEFASWKWLQQDISKWQNEKN